MVKRTADGRIACIMDGCESPTLLDTKGLGLSGSGIHCEAHVVEYFNQMWGGVKVFPNLDAVLTHIREARSHANAPALGYGEDHGDDVRRDLEDWTT